MKYVPDTSVIISGKFYELISREGGEVIIPEAVISEIEAQANRGLMIGFTGLNELEKIIDLYHTNRISLSFGGKRPERWQIERAKIGEIDEMIRNVAMENDATLVTQDYVQYTVARIKGIDVIFLGEKKVPKVKIEDFFDDQTMSVHLKVNTIPMAKKGSPGHFQLYPLTNSPMNEEDLNNIANDIIERARGADDSYIEYEMKGVTVVQLREYRIVVTRRPFSDGLEITAVKPIVKFSIEHYGLDEKLLKRLLEPSRGILISGAPGAGKTTFAQAVAEFYAKNGKVVKTMERPRDLQVSEEITQYTALEGDMEKTGNILLMVRPDYTIFDEVRTTEDFKVYADLRLAGVGMVGVVHSTKAVDAIQRLIGRIELGMIPQIVDTVMHVQDGNISKILTLEYVVKIPSGMTEQDLARPVIVVKDYYTGNVEYEIYSFGEEVVVIPVKEERSRIIELAEAKIYDLLKKHLGMPFKVKLVNENLLNLYVYEDEIPEVIGWKGTNIEDIEDIIGMHIEVYPLLEEKITKEINVEKKKDFIYLIGDESLAGRNGAIFAENDYLFDIVFSKGGIAKIKFKSEQGKKLMDALMENKKIFFKG